MQFQTALLSFAASVSAAAIMPRQTTATFNVSEFHISSNSLNVEYGFYVLDNALGYSNCRYTAQSSDYDPDCPGTVEVANVPEGISDNAAWQWSLLAGQESATEPPQQGFVFRINYTNTYNDGDDHNVNLYACRFISLADDFTCVDNDTTFIKEYSGQTAFSMTATNNPECIFA